MADPFLAEIRIFPFNFAPKGWAWCDGQLMPLSQNTALFSLLGTTYGGDGKSNFALPDLQGSVPIHAGQGPGLSEYFLGQQSGTETVTLLDSEMAGHSHSLSASTSAGDTNLAAGGFTGTGSAIYAPPAALTPMSPQALAVAGSSFPHNNMMPYLTYYFNIALQGVFPPRT